ncbi:MAG TPA: winged helix DNA-binding domain-containing protein [Actinomycetota bacterium]|nr:winged helix DNA-binding domain-containing protein [Actinomycetota bacterium]
MTERTLSETQLNRALLARQLLLERASLPLPRAVERVGGLQTQYAPSAYIALWSRLAGFRRDDLTTALEKRTVVQGTLMRATIHVVSARDYPLFAAGVRRARREWWVRVHRRAIDAKQMTAAARRVRSLLADGPLRGNDLAEHLDADNVRWNGVNLWIDLLRVPPSGTWEQRRADLFAAAEVWLGSSEATAEQGVQHLVRRYLGGFGPASLKDVAAWTGLPARILEPVIQRLRLRRFRSEGGDELFDLPRAPLPDPATPAPVRFLPTWDATLLVHARRTQILPEPYRPLVFNTKTPHSVPTFLVDGRVAGTWRIVRGTVLIDPFERLPATARRALDDESERLSVLHA